MKTGETATVKVTREIKTTGGVSLSPGTYSGVYSEAGGVVHEQGEGVYKVYRVPSVKVEDNKGYGFNLTYLDSSDIPAFPKTLVDEYDYEFMMGTPIYRRQNEGFH